MKPGFRAGSAKGFTMVELLCVMVILVVMFQMGVPLVEKVRKKAESTACGSNLRQIGVAVESAVQDNNGRYPRIETDPNDPVYVQAEGEDQFEGEPPKSLFDTLEPYGITEQVMKCPADIRNNNQFAKSGSSYEWRPLIDDEPSLNPQIYMRWGVRTIKPSRFRLVTDVDSVHNGGQNALYADGHVKMR